MASEKRGNFEAFERIGMDPGRRGETLSVEEFASCRMNYTIISSLSGNTTQVGLIQSINYNEKL